jgi:hypothetical protein
MVMMRFGDAFQQWISVGITALMLTLSVAVPVLERAEVSNETVAESQHDPATCPRGHDHTVCAQIGASVSAPAESAAPPIAHTFLRFGAVASAHEAVTSAVPEGHPSRAPPLA